jgi:glycosyltransferase involved in cell wall biosynthesis
LIRLHELEDKFFLLGFVEDASTYLKGCNYFVLPSLSEGLALVILEAMQAGLPIAASNVGGIPEALDNYKKTKLFEAKNSDDMIEKITSLIKEYPVIERRFGSTDPEKSSPEENTDFQFKTMYHKTLEVLFN